MEIDHLGPEAIAALVDGELSRGAAERAQIHLVHCAECRGEVAAQRDVARTVRSAMAGEGLGRLPNNSEQGENVLQGLPEAFINRLAAIPEQFEANAERGAGPDHRGERSRKRRRAKRGRNFDIAGRRFPRTMGDKLELLIHQLRSSGRS